MAVSLWRHLCLALALGAGCGGGDSAEPLFPEDYAATYEEVRDCRGSGDHDFNNIRILADPAALTPYMDRAAPFPEGSVVLKEEYGYDDDTCAGDIIQWSVMVRQAEGSAPTMLDWRWQRVESNRSVAEDDEPRCASCHSTCTETEGGYMNTCAVEDL